MNGSTQATDQANSPQTDLAALTESASQRRDSVLARIEAACELAARPASSVQLLAVSKTMSAMSCLAMARAGQRSFGENYLQEALNKQEALRDQWQGEALEWHFIGPVQSNKTRALAEHFDWVHTVDRLRIARRLSDQRPATLPALQICLQVNIDAEATKSGCLPAEAPALAAEIAALPRLTLRGLMAIPAATDDPSAQRQAFANLRALRAECQAGLALAGLGELPELDTLSMGMTGDLEAAVAEGATIVRIGTALFGPRASIAPH